MSPLVAKIVVYMIELIMGHFRGKNLTYFGYIGKVGKVRNGYALAFLFRNCQFRALTISKTLMSGNKCVFVTVVVRRSV